MKRQIAVAAVLAATLVGAAACSSSSSGGNGNAGKPAASSTALNGAGKTLKVWLMVDAQSGWPQAVADTNTMFEQQTGAKVDVEYQQWANITTKVQTTLQGSDVPDVIELGNTQESQFVFEQGYADLTSQVSSFPNSSGWLTGLSGPCQANGKTFCIPYYAGSRVLIYRTDEFQALGLSAPQTWADVMSDAAKLQAKYGKTDKKYSAFYMPGAYWYAAMSFVYGAGGAIATQGSDGSWTGSLESAQAEQGLQQWADLAKQYSHGDPTKNESDQDAIFATGDSGMLYGNGWELGGVQSQPKDPNDPSKGNVDTKVKGKVAAVPLPGASAGNPLPSFLGGSDLAVPVKSQNQDLAIQWLKDYTSTQIQTELVQKGVLPNSKALLPLAAQQPGGGPAAQAAQNSWFTPASPNWSNVESANVMQTMLVNIVTGKQTVDVAAKAADAQITSILNKS